jgi:hypothetical protein
MKPLYCSRPDKLEHPDTVLYEIYMLRFAAAQLDQNKTDKDAWVYLESFLLHFRNLIEFLGRKSRRDKDPKDLGVETMCRHLAEDDLKCLREQGGQLFEQYERVDGSISQYLAHCTEARVVNKQWHVDGMYDQIEPFLKQLEDCLKPSNNFSSLMKRVPPVVFEGPLFASATTSTNTASGVQPIVRPDTLE